jgi:predicted acylesterase/phospholipase RssA
MLIALGDNEAILIQATRQLDEKWQNTASAWRDKARDDFDRKHLEELLAGAKAAQRAMRAVGDLLRQAVAECS